jgi:hypothetical protein
LIAAEVVFLSPGNLRAREVEAPDFNCGVTASFPEREARILTPPPLQEVAVARAHKQHA